MDRRGPGESLLVKEGRSNARLAARRKTCGENKRNGFTTNGRGAQQDGPSDSRTPIGGVHASAAPHREPASQSDFRARPDASALCARTPLLRTIFSADAYNFSINRPTIHTRTPTANITTTGVRMPEMTTAAMVNPRAILSSLHRWPRPRARRISLKIWMPP